jgi:hypothetical protein
MPWDANRIEHHYQGMSWKENCLNSLPTLYSTPALRQPRKENHTWSTNLLLHQTTTINSFQTKCLLCLGPFSTTHNSWLLLDNQLVVGKHQLFEQS